MKRLALLTVLVAAVAAGWWWASDGSAPPARVTEGASADPGAGRTAMPTPDLRVSCDAPTGLQEGTHDVIELLAEGGGRSTVGVVSDGRLELLVQAETGRGGLYPIGWDQGVLAWEDGRCRFLEPPRALGAVHGMVEGWHEFASHTMWVLACRADGSDCSGVTPDADGSFFMERPAGEPLVLQTQMTGQETWRGPKVEVVPDAARDIVVALRTPESAAGLGVILEGEGSHGLVVGDVLQGTAADRAHLRRGDVLLERDGRALLESDMESAPTRAAPARDVRLLVRDPTGSEREVVLLATR